MDLPSMEVQQSDSTSSRTVDLGPGAGELDLFAFFLLLRRHLARTALFAGAGMLAMVAYTLAVKPKFSATATILVPLKTPSSASLAMQAVGGGLDLFGSSYDVYVDILHSRTVADVLIKQFNLGPHFGAKTLEEAERTLEADSVIAVHKEGLLSVTVTDTDPKLASDLANSYFSALDNLNLHLAITAAGQQRAYFEQQMVQEKDALADAEVALERDQQKTGVVAPDLQVQAGLSALEQTRAQIRARQVQLGALEQGATAQNPEVIRLRAEISGLQGQLAGLQSGGGSELGSPVSRIPEKNLDFVRAAREVKFHETLFDMLARQYESAKEQEAKEISMIEILDPAIPAKRKSWPPRTLYCLAGLAVGGLLGLLYTVLEAFLSAVVLNPGNRARYAAFSLDRKTSRRRGATG